MILILLFLQENDGMATNAFLSPGKSHAFGGSCLDVDDIGRNPASLSKYLPASEGEKRPTEAPDRRG